MPAVGWAAGRCPGGAGRARRWGAAVGRRGARDNLGWQGTDAAGGGGGYSRWKRSAAGFLVYPGVSRRARKREREGVGRLGAGGDGQWAGGPGVSLPCRRVAGRQGATGRVLVNDARAGRARCAGERVGAG